MSFPYCGKLLIATKKNLEKALLREKVLRQSEPIKDRNYAHRLVGNIFARYIVLCNNLSEIYDQTLQAQKRVVIEKILICSELRLLELQKEMQKIEMNEIVYLDDVLLELKLTTQNVEFLCPFYFPRMRDIEIQNLVEDVPKVAEVKPENVKGLERFRKVMTAKEIEEKQRQEQMKFAVNLIKRHEKAKQARVKSLNAKLFPDIFKPKRRELPTVDYEFIYKPDQAPLFKIKRSKYKFDFFKPKAKLVRFAFYEPPQIRLNHIGQKVIVKRKKSEFVELMIVDESDEEERAKNAEENERQKRKLQIKEYEKQNAAARVIQRYFRRYQKKKTLQREKTKRMELCGLIYRPDERERLKKREIEDKHNIKRRERKKKFDERLLAAIEDEKARIIKLKSGSIMEDISEDIREWFKMFYDEAKDFHNYPGEFEGGTVLVLRGETKTPEEFLIEKNKTKAQKLKEKQEKKKKKKAEKALKIKNSLKEKKAEEDRKKIEKKEGPTWEFTDKRFDSKHFDELESFFNYYKKEWQFFDEMENRTEAPIWEWVTIDAYADVHKELRIIVDDFMRIELELLRFALTVDNKTRYNLPKRKKPKKKKKRKESVDVTEGRSLDECYQELKKLNIIRKYPKRSLNDFIGGLNFAAHEMRMMNKNPIPHYGDVKNTLRSLVLGMGPLELPKVKSFLIAGPPRCGKKFLVESLCTEMKAVIFDLSPIKVAPILDMVGFLKTLVQVAKKVQPSVIFIDGAHKPFIRKISEGGNFENPRKLGRFLFKSVVKKMTNEDAVMIIGTTNDPLNCSFAQLRMCFEKIIMFPPTLDYETALMTWNKGLELKRIFNFNASPIAHVTRNYAIGDILDLIDKHVNLRRRMQFTLKPLTSDELMEDLISGPNSKQPLDEKTIASYNLFGSMIDNFFVERRDTMARVQLEIDKEKEIEAKRLEKLNKQKVQK